MSSGSINVVFPVLSGSPEAEPSILNGGVDVGASANRSPELTPPTPSKSKHGSRAEPPSDRRHLSADRLLGLRLAALTGGGGDPSVSGTYADGGRAASVGGGEASRG